MAADLEKLIREAAERLRQGRAAYADSPDLRTMMNRMRDDEQTLARAYLTLGDQQVAARALLLRLDEDDWNTIQGEIAKRQAYRMDDGSGGTQPIIPEGESNDAGAILAEVVRDLDEYRDLYDLARDLSEWSQATFGTDAERGPIGPLKHLAKEAVEAQQACERFNDFAEMEDTCAANSAFDDLHVELADCFILVLDAARRAKLKPLELIRKALAKMEVNKARTYPRPTTDEPSEHVRG